MPILPENNEVGPDEDAQQYRMRFGTQLFYADPRNGGYARRGALPDGDSYSWRGQQGELPPTPDMVYDHRHAEWVSLGLLEWRHGLFERQLCDELNMNRMSKK